jgi:hypothetical protein
MTDLRARIDELKARAGDVPVDVYVMFDSHVDAMEMQERARHAGLHTRISTAPREIKSSCGVTVLVSSEEAERLERLAEDESLSYESFTPLVRQIDPRRDRYC